MPCWPSNDVVANVCFEGEERKWRTCCHVAVPPIGDNAGRSAPLQAMSPGPGRLARLRSVWVRDARRVVCSCGLRYRSFIRLAPFGLPQPVTASYPAAAL
jgi:hypothetical protein